MDSEKKWYFPFEQLNSYFERASWRRLEAEHSIKWCYLWKGMIKFQKKPEYKLYLQLH